MADFKERQDLFFNGSNQAGIDDLERHARAHDLVIVATGKGTLGGLFAVFVYPGSYPQRVTVQPCF
jgi:hypothetical protein